MKVFGISVNNGLPQITQLEEIAPYYPMDVLQAIANKIIIKYRSWGHNYSGLIFVICDEALVFKYIES